MDNTCCLCGFSGEKYDVNWCRACEHFFCSQCRWNVWGRDGRAMAWVKEFVLKQPPLYCQREGHNGIVGGSTGPS